MVSLTETKSYGWREITGRNQTRNMEHFQHKNIWFYDDDYPSTLSEVEMNDPLGVICNFFNQYTLTQAKRYLWHSIRYNLTDITAPTKELRPKYHRFLLDTERLMDAAWLLRMSALKEKVIRPDQFSTDYLKSVRNQDLISFLGQAEVSRPQKVLNEFFNYDCLCRWKTCFLESLRKSYRKSIIQSILRSSFIRGLY